MGGQNAIYDANDDADPYDDERYIYNEGSNTIYAEAVWWGTTDEMKIQMHIYNQNVSYDPYLTSDPTTAAGASLESDTSFSYPELEVQTTQQKGKTSSDKSKKTDQWLSNRIGELQQWIKNNTTSEQVGDKLVELYSLQLIDKEDELGKKDGTMGIIRSWKKRLKNLSTYEDVNEAQRRGMRKAAEHAVLFLQKEGVMQENTKKVIELADTYEDHINMRHNKRSLHLNKVTAYFENANYQIANEALADYKAVTKESDVNWDMYNRIHDALQHHSDEKLQKHENIAYDQKLGSEDVPEKFALHQSYPNPFNPRTNVPFSLANDAHVTLKVYNTIGRHVKTLVDKNMDQGKHEVRFNAGSLPSGIYFLRMQAQTKAGNSYSFLEKVTLLK